VTDPAQDLAARGALAGAVEILGVEIERLSVREVVRRRRRDTKVPFYYVTVEDPTGTRLILQVSDDGRRVELDYPRKLPFG